MSQESGAPCAHGMQWPQERRTVAVTRSPRAKSPASRSTRPSSSWPSTSRSSPSGATPNRPSEISRSVPQTPISSGRTSTVPGAAVGAGTLGHLGGVCAAGERDEALHRVILA